MWIALLICKLFTEGKLFIVRVGLVCLACLWLVHRETTNCILDLDYSLAGQGTQMDFMTGCACFRTGMDAQGVKLLLYRCFGGFLLKG